MNTPANDFAEVIANQPQIDIKQGDRGGVVKAAEVIERLNPPLADGKLGQNENDLAAGISLLESRHPVILDVVGELIDHQINRMGVVELMKPSPERHASP